MRTRKHIKVTRDYLEERAFHNRTQVVVDHKRHRMETRIDGVTLWAELGEVW